MRKLILIAAILLNPVVSNAAVFKSFKEILTVFHKAGYPVVMEVPLGQVLVHRAEDKDEEGHELDVWSTAMKNATAVPALDYDGPNFSLATALFGHETYRAYKVSDSFLCYHYEGPSLAESNTTFARCLVFPAPIDEVLRKVAQ